MNNYDDDDRRSSFYEGRLSMVDNPSIDDAARSSMIYDDQTSSTIDDRLYIIDDYWLIGR